MRQLPISWRLLIAVAGACWFGGRSDLGYRPGVPRRGLGGACLATAMAAVLAAVGAGLSPSAALASSASVPSWTNQHPAASPPGRGHRWLTTRRPAPWFLFGGTGEGRLFGTTWTWGSN